MNFAMAAPCYGDPSNFAMAALHYSGPLPITLCGKSIAKLWSVTCYMGLVDHSGECFSLNPSQIGRYLIYLPGGMEG